MEEIMSGEATPSQIASYLTALRMKGETVEEIVGSALVMREKVVRCDVGNTAVVDTCGTGGDEKRTFNISTAAALVATGTGAKVAKHGNRSVSSSCGSADVLEALGVKIDADVSVAKRCIAEAGIGFLFAPMLHPAMKHAMTPRREMGIRTIFNILGPLTNPAGARRQVLGVFREDLTETLANVLKALGSERAFVVHGMDGLDEISITSETKVAELESGRVETYQVSPEDFGLRRSRLEDLIVNTVEESAKAVREVLSGERGPKRDVVLLNGGCVLVAAGLARDIGEGIRLSGESIDSGNARRALERLVALSNGQSA